MIDPADALMIALGIGIILAYLEIKYPE